MIENKTNSESLINTQEIDLLDIIRKIIAMRKTIFKAVVIGLIIGIIVALSIPKKIYGQSNFIS